MFVIKITDIHVLVYIGWQFRVFLAGGSILNVKSLRSCPDSVGSYVAVIVGDEGAAVVVVNNRQQTYYQNCVCSTPSPRRKFLQQSDAIGVDNADTGPREAPACAGFLHVSGFSHLTLLELIRVVL